jgi:hypothetical protein
MAALAPVALRQYRFSDGILTQLADHTAQNLTRDLAQLAERGISEATVTHLLNLRNTFADLPTGPEAQGLITEAVETKNTARDAALVLMRRLRTAAQNVWGQGMGSYNRFRFEGIDRLSDDVLPRALGTTLRVGTALQAALAAEGIDAAFLASYQLSITNYNNAIEGVDIATEERDRMTEERLTAGNALYKEIVRLCNIGKDVFATISQATYQTYVIEKFAGTGSQSATRKGQLQASETKAVNTEKLSIKPSTRLHLFGEEGSHVRYYFADSPGAAHQPGTPYVDTGPDDDMVYMASEIGYSTARTYLTVQNLHPTPATYKVIIAQ